MKIDKIRGHLGPSKKFQGSQIGFSLEPQGIFRGHFGFSQKATQLFAQFCFSPNSGFSGLRQYQT